MGGWSMEEDLDETFFPFLYLKLILNLPIGSI